MFFFFIPIINLSLSEKLHHFSSSFTAECYAIRSALQYIYSTNICNILTASDSQSCLLVLLSNPFNFFISPLILIIKSLVYRLHLVNKTVNFLWTPSHLGIVGNETADRVAFSYKSFINFSSFKTPFSDILHIHRKIIWNDW